MIKVRPYKRVCSGRTPDPTLETLRWRHRFKFMCTARFTPRPWTEVSQVHALPSLAVERLKFHCYKKNPIRDKHTFLSRQFLFCLTSVNATSCTGSCSDPPGQRSESTAIRGWQHLHSLFYPGRSEQMLEMKGISSQIPVFTAQLSWSAGNPWIISQPFFGAATKNTALLWQVLATWCCGP